MVEGEATVAEEQSLQAPLTEVPKPTRLSLDTRCLLYATCGLGLAALACVTRYKNGGDMGSLALILVAAGLFLSVAALYAVQLGINTLLRKPAHLQSLPVALGMAVFGLAALFGALIVVPYIYQQHIDSLKRSAVQTVEGYHQRNGRYPDTADKPEGLSDEVSYKGAWVKRGYTLYICDRFSIGEGWRFESGAGTWTYGYEYD